jgi:SAM-dependent methyltransferase
MLELVAGSRGSPGFDPHFFSTLREVEDRHFWFVGRREVVLSALRRAVPDLAARRLFDVGCGSGGLLAFLRRSGVTVAGACDVYPESLRLVRAQVDVPLVRVDEGRRLPLGRGYDLFGMFDVLEHIDDDIGALRALRESLAPGGVLVLTVPAHPRLYDEMDEIAFHRRRYERAGLRRALEESGFEVRLLSHFMSPLVPILVLMRSAGRRLHGGRSRALERRRAEFRVVPGVNALMRGVLAVERAVMTHVTVPFGSSLVAVAVRGR